MLKEVKVLSAVAESPKRVFPFSKGLASKVNVQPLVSDAFAQVPELLGQVTTDRKTGLVRMLPGEPFNGQTAIPFDGDYKAHALRFLQTEQVAKLLGTNQTKLRLNDIETFNFGGRIPVARVTFQQWHPLGDGTLVQVHNALVSVVMDQTNGNVINVASGIELGTSPREVGKLLGKRKAIAKAKQTVKAIGKVDTECELRLSEHNGKFSLIYAVTVSCKTLSRIVLLEARTGAVLFNKNLRYYSATSPQQQAGLNKVPAKTLLRIPEPNTPLFQQVRDFALETLDDPTILANRIVKPLVMNKTGNWEPVKAKADGTFNFDVNSSDTYERDCFCAVYVLVCETSQDLFYEAHGGKQAPQIPVEVNNTTEGKDNAFFSPSEYKEVILMGSGLDQGGLNALIVLDGGVLTHESGHKRDHVQIPGGPRGPWGRAAGEGRAGDIDGQVVCQILWRIRFAQDDQTPVLTVGELKSWKGIIGPYALPPNGIRKQKNNKQYPSNGRPTEVHDDGEIIGGACYDLLIAFLTDGKQDGQAVTEADLGRFVDLEMAASSLLPSRSQTFLDFLVAQRTADKTLTGGKDRQRIDKAHAGHGITDSMKIDVPSYDTDKLVNRRRHPVTKSRCSKKTA